MMSCASPADCIRCNFSCAHCDIKSFSMVFCILLWTSAENACCLNSYRSCGTYTAYMLSARHYRWSINAAWSEARIIPWPYWNVGTWGDSRNVRRTGNQRWLGNMVFWIGRHPKSEKMLCGKKMFLLSVVQARYREEHHIFWMFTNFRRCLKVSVLEHWPFIRYAHVMKTCIASGTQHETCKPCSS